MQSQKQKINKILNPILINNYLVDSITKKSSKKINRNIIHTQYNKKQQKKTNNNDSKISSNQLNLSSGKKYIFNNTTYCTPYDKSTMLSYISTPLEKSFKMNISHLYRKKYKEKNKNQEKDRNSKGKQWKRQSKVRNYRSLKKLTITNQELSTQEQTHLKTVNQNNYIDQILTVTYVLGEDTGKSQSRKNLKNKIKYQNIFVKQFMYFDSLEIIKQQFIAQFINSNMNFKNNYYGLLGFQIIPSNYKLFKLLNNIENSEQSFKIEYFLQNNIKQLKLEPILLKNKPSYQKLEFKDFEILEYLGSGGFSTVYLSKCLVDYNYCALKFIKKQNLTSNKKIKMLENQKNILFTIQHQNLINLLYAFQTKNYIVFGLEYCCNGNLFTLLQRVKQFSQEQSKFIFKQILNGLEYLHQNNILFRDIKLENILFNENGVIKITDFGLSKPDVQENQITYSYCGSPQYMAPQMLAKAGHDFSVDYYALGILLYQLIYGKSPFYASKKQDIFVAIMTTQPTFPKFPAVSKQVKALIKGLLTKNPKHRIGSLKGIKEISSHPWLRGYNIAQKIIESQQRNLFGNLFSISAVKNQKLTLKDQSKEQNYLRLKQQLQLQKQHMHIQKCFLQQIFINKLLIESINRNLYVFGKNQQKTYQKDIFKKYKKQTLNKKVYKSPKKKNKLF